jgi:hypothetical protein
MDPVSTDNAWTAEVRQKFPNDDRVKAYDGKSAIRSSNSYKLAIYRQLARGKAEI